MWSSRCGEPPQQVYSLPCLAVVVAQLLVAVSASAVAGAARASCVAGLGLGLVFGVAVQGAASVPAQLRVAAVGEEPDGLVGLGVGVAEVVAVVAVWCEAAVGFAKRVGVANEAAEHLIGRVVASEEAVEIVATLVEAYEMAVGVAEGVVQS